MRLILTLSLISLPFLEIWGLFKFGSLYGWWFLFYLLMMAYLGWRLIQDEKNLVLSKVMTMLSQGGNVFSVILGSAKNLMAGVLFLIPGVITDVIGFILLLIPIKNLNNRDEPTFTNSPKKENDNIIEGEYKREEDNE